MALLNGIKLTIRYTESQGIGRGDGSLVNYKRVRLIVCM